MRKGQTKKITLNFTENGFTRMTSRKELYTQMGVCYNTFFKRLKEKNIELPPLRLITPGEANKLIKILSE